MVLDSVNSLPLCVCVCGGGGGGGGEYLLHLNPDLIEISGTGSTSSLQ